MTLREDLRKIPPSLLLLVVARSFDAAAAVGLVTIVGKQVYDMTGSELSLGLLGLVEFLPALLLAPFSGAVADRFDRRHVAALFTGGLVIVALALFVYVGTDPTSTGPIYALMLGYGVLRAFQRPASRSLAIDLSPPDVLERVVALSSVSTQTGLILGPALAGALFVQGIALPYLAAALLLLGATLSLIGLPKSKTERLQSRGAKQAIVDAVEGLRFVRRAPVVGAAITLDLFSVLLGGAVALLPAIAEDRLGVGAVGLGWLRSAVAIGATLVAIGLAVRPVARRVGVVLLVAVAIFGLGTIALGLTTNFVVALVALAVLGGADSVSMFIRATLVPLATPANMRGRVLALESVFIGASNELGAFESGVTAAWFGLVGAVLFGGVGTLVVVGVFWFLVPSLRQIDRFADVRPQPAPDHREA